MKFKLGDKVKIPEQKTFGFPYETSETKKYVDKYNPKFLYITNVFKNLYDLGITETMRLNTFNENDLEPYIKSNRIFIFEED